MDEKVFLECLKLKKLFDVEDRPLRLHKHAAVAAKEKDTFFRCISIALMSTDKYCVQIRAACVMRFIALIFSVPPECSSVVIFLNEYANDAVVRGMAYCDKAIQMWFYTHTPCSSMAPQVAFKTKKDVLRDCALEFVRQNNQIGYMSCKFTFGYLLASLYGVSLHLYDQLEEHGAVHQQPVICTPHRRGEHPEETEQKQRHIYIWAAPNSFKLLVPIVGRPQTRTQHWIKEKMMMHAQHKYQLRASDENKLRNVHLCDFERLRDTDIHVCDVPAVRERSIYQIYPAGGDFKLYMEPQEHLLVFCVRESNQDIHPYLELLVELKHSITYPYFMLKEDAKRVVVLVTDKYRDEAIELVKKELNVD